ncbi:MAG: AI-2E family transporter [Chloroflexota bacterium]|nr:AI-2E family transporter [Chloroflexota bacterium]
MKNKSPIDSIISDTADAPLPSAGELQRVVVHLPVNVRNASMVVVAVLLSVFALSWAKAVFIPICLGLMASYALTPVVDRLQRWHIPRVVGAAVLLTAIVGALGWTAYRLGDDATALIESLPEVAQKVRQTLQAREGSGAKQAGAIDRVQQAATELEKAADGGAAGGTTGTRGVTKVQIEKPKFNVQDYFLTGTLGVAALIGQATVVFFLTFFLLASGNTFRRKMVKIAGSTFSEKKLTVQALDEITEQIQRYLLVQVFTSLLVALATWLAFLWIGVQHAAAWGLVAGVLNFVPYFGSIVFTAVAATVGLMQFGTIESALLIAGVSLGLHSVSGYMLTPWLTSRTSSMSAVTVFVGVLAWGWLWGLWGVLLGVPILMAVKAVCDRIDGLKPVGELLGS